MMATSTIQSVTLDTNIPQRYPGLVTHAKAAGIAVVIASVSERELADTANRRHISNLDVAPEIGVYGESRYGQCSGATQDDPLEEILRIIDPGFPRPAKRDHLSAGHLRQLRDAMILATHRRDGRDALVTDDLKAFIKAGRRDLLEAAFGVRILTGAEFAQFLDWRCPVTTEVER